MIEYLDVPRLPFERTYECADGSKIEVAKFISDLKPAIEAFTSSKLIKANPSFGFAMAAPQIVGNYFNGELWDDPYKFVWFVGGWGDDRDRYIANAVRKMRAMLREGTRSSLDIRFSQEYFFRDVVDSKEHDGRFRWGDFPWGGAVFIQMGSLILEGAISCLSEIEDDVIARVPLGLFGQKVVYGNRLLAA